MYAVGTTNEPAFVRILPVNVAMPPVAIGELAAGEKSNEDVLVGATPVAGIRVNSDAVSAELFTRLLPARSNAFCVADDAWKTLGTTEKRMFQHNRHMPQRCRPCYNPWLPRS